MKSWVARQRNLIDFALSSLGRRKAKNLSLVLCYTLIVFLLSSVLFFSGSIRHEALAVLEESPQLVVQRLIGGRQTLISATYASKIADIRGVGAVEARLWGYYYHPAAGANYTIVVSPNVTHMDTAAEVGNGVLRSWQVRIGDPIYFKTFDGQAVSLTVASTFAAATELVSADLIMMSETSYRRIFGIPSGMATDFTVSIRNPSEIQTIAAKILERLPDVRVLSKDEMQRTYTALFDWRSGYVMVLLAGALLAFFIFAVDRASGLSAEEKAEIAVLKAVGWETSEVLLLRMWEGLVISLSAFVAGVIAAYVHVFFSSAPLFEHALKGWAVLYPSFKLTPVFSAYELSVIFALTVIPYTLITIVPAWRAAITDPDTAMRSV